MDGSGFGSGAGDGPGNAALLFAELSFEGGVGIGDAGALELPANALSIAESS
jgi:hypothetical protein